MSASDNDGLQQIFKTINELFAEEVGPVAAILCQEAKQAWFDELRASSQRPSLGSLPNYISLLKTHIDDEHSLQRFEKGLQAIKSLNASQR